MTKALVVEDEMLNRRLFELVLTRGGFTVVVASDVPEARQAIADELPDVVILDIQLPGIDGLQFARELRAATRTRAIPIVAVSANAMDSHREAALQAGCNGYITKPINTRTFTDALNAMMQAA